MDITSVYKPDTWNENRSRNHWFFRGIKIALQSIMKVILRTLAFFALFPAFASASCPNPGPEMPGETLSALKAHSKKGKITCIQDLGATMDAPHYVIILDESAATAHLKRTGGGWSKGTDYGATTVSIGSDNRGFVPVKKIHSIDSNGMNTDELRLTINGARGEARVRLDDGTSSKYLNLSFRCE
jgi:hypothetical protein